MQRDPFQFAVIAGLMLTAFTSTAMATVLRNDLETQVTETLGKGFPATVNFIPDGSGTLVDPQWVITAAHVARGLSVFGKSVVVGDQRFAISRIVFHPGSGRIPGQAPVTDAALIRLARPVVGIKPIELYERSDEVGQVAFVVGYGDYATAGQDTYTPQNGVRRAVSNRIEGTLQDYLYIDFDPYESATDLEGVSAPGDSGGSLYLEAADGHTLAGISAFSIGSPLAYGSRDHFTRVSVIRDWIESTVQGAGQNAAAQIIELVPGDCAATGQVLIACEFIESFNRNAMDFELFAERHGGGQTWGRLAERRALYGRLTTIEIRVLNESHIALRVDLQKRPKQRVINFFFEPGSSVLTDVGIGMPPPPNALCDDELECSDT